MHASDRNLLISFFIGLFMGIGATLGITNDAARVHAEAVDDARAQLKIAEAKVDEAKSVSKASQATLAGAKETLEQQKYIIDVQEKLLVYLDQKYNWSDGHYKLHQESE